MKLPTSHEPSWAWSALFFHDLGRSENSLIEEYAKSAYLSIDKRIVNEYKLGYNTCMNARWYEHGIHSIEKKVTLPSVQHS